MDESDQEDRRDRVDHLWDLADGAVLAVLDDVGVKPLDSNTPVMDDWQDVDGALERTFELGSFGDAIAFVNRVAALAEAEDHHPDIRIAYRKVTLRWTTHSAGGITDRDRELAGRSDELQ